MRSDIKAQWVQALRSGKYTQGHNYLKIGENYCCLGVLCSVLGTPAISIGFKKYEDKELPVYTYHNFVTSIPEWVRAPLGLSSRAQDHLINMNDCYGHTFSEIADYIEQHL